MWAKGRETKGRKAHGKPFISDGSSMGLASTALKSPQKFSYHLTFYHHIFAAELSLGKWPSRCCKGLWMLRQRPWTALCITESVLSAEHQADVLTVMVVAKQRELMAVFCTEVFRMCGLAEWSGGQECIGHPGQTQARLNGTPLMADGKGKFAAMVVGICSSKEFKRSTRLHTVLAQSHASPP